MASLSQLRGFIRDIEEQVLKAYASQSYRAVAQSSLARGLLREVARTILPRKPDELVWIAFVTPPYAEDCWYLSDFTEDASYLPLPIVVPTGIAALTSHVAAELSQRETAPHSTSLEKFAPFDVPMHERRNWHLANGIEDMWVRHVDLGREIVDSFAVEGLVAAGFRLPVGARIEDVGDAVDEALACVTDRLRLAWAAENRPIRVLSSLDDAYQTQLVLARQAAGLQEFLTELEEGKTTGGLRDADELLAETEEVAVSPAEVVSEGNVASTDVRTAFVEAIRRINPPDEHRVIAQVRVSRGGTAALQTPYGNWHGWAEYRHGLAELRVRPVVLGVAVDLADVNRMMATFIAHTRGRRREAALIVLVPAAIESAVSSILNDWKEVADVNYGIMPEPN